MLITRLKEHLSEAIRSEQKKRGLPQIRHIYYFVPQCPLCSSWHTGRYITKSFTDPDYVDRKSLEHGEIIRQVPREPIKNCFCEECGYEWAANVQTKFLTTDEIIKQQKIRGTYEIYQTFKEDYYVKGKPPKSHFLNRWFL